MDYEDKSCANCEYVHYSGNICMPTNRRCYNLEKWVPNKAVKLLMVRKMMKEIMKLIDLV